MQLFHHYHLRKKYRILHSDFWLFEFSVWLHVFARALIAVFIPILLLDTGYSLQEVILYYVLYNLFDVPLNFTARWLTRKIGARMTITLGTFFSIAFFALLGMMVPGNWYLLALLALIAAIYDVLYWVAHIYFFMESSKKRHSASEDASFLSIVRQLGGLLAPVFGAVILIFFQQHVLIGVSVFILLLSIVPLLMAKGVADKPRTKQKTAKQFFKKPSVLRDYLSVGLFGIHGSAEAVIWPVFVFVLYESLESVAIIPVIVSVTTIIFTYFAGKIHKRGREKAIALGAFLLVFLWISRLVVDAPFFYFVSVFLVGLFSVFVTIPMDSNVYEFGEKTDPLTASMYRNLFSMFAKLVFFSVLALFVSVFETSFILASGSMLLLFSAAFFFGSKK